MSRSVADLTGEIAPGLVLHLDPEALEANGATCTDPPDVRVKGSHFFLCVASVAGESRWVPLFTKPSKVRIEISPDGRTGHPKWVNGTFHYHPAQIWTATPPAIFAAAAAGKDMSRVGARNLLNQDTVPKV